MKNYNPIGNSINGIISLPDVVIEGTLTVNGDIIGNVNETIENIISNTATIGNATITNATINNLWNNSDIYSKNYNFYGNSLTNGGFNISTDINNNLSFFRITGTVGSSSSNSQVASLSSTGNLTIVGNGFFPSAIIPSGTVGSLFSNISTITSLSNTNQTSINLLNTNLSSSNARITNLTSSSTFSVNSLITNLTSSNIRGTYSTIVNMVSDNAQITSLTALSNSEFNGDIYFYQNNPSIFGNGSIGPLTINPNFGSDNYVRILDRLNVSGTLDVTGSLTAQGNSNTIGNLFTTGGNVGIGTGTPSYTLTARGSGGTSGTVLAFDHTNDTPYVGIGFNEVADGLAFYSNIASTVLNTIPMFIKRTDSNIGIGTTSPSSRLHVAGSTLIGGTGIDNFAFGIDAQTNPRLGVVKKFGSPPALAFSNNSAFNIQVANSNDISNVSTNTYNTLMTITTNGNIGIGISTPNAPLQFPASGASRKIVLFEAANNDHEFYGFGIDPFILRYQVNAFNASHVFYAGTGISSSRELMRITGTGNVGIGTANPQNRLHVENGSIQCSSNDGDKIYLTQFTSGPKISQLPGWGVGIYAGQSTDNNGFISFNAGNHTERMRITNSGNVGIGTNSPFSTLHVNNDAGNNYLTISGPANVQQAIEFRDTATRWVVYKEANETTLNFWNGAQKVITFSSRGNINQNNYIFNSIVTGNTYAYVNTNFGTLGDKIYYTFNAYNDPATNNWVVPNGGYKSHAMALGFNGIEFWHGTANGLAPTTGSLYINETGIYPASNNNRALGDTSLRWSNIVGTSINVNGNSNTIGSIITTGGNVGINISSPTAPLNVNGKVIIGRNTTTNDTFLEIDRTSSTGGTVFIQAVTTHNLNYGNLCLNPNYGAFTGFVGIGTTSPTYQLTVASDSAAKPSTNTWTISSDARLKTNITQANLDTCYDNVKNIPLKRYTWLDSVYTVEQVPDRSKLGWIAQDVENILPKSVEIKNQHGIEDCRSLNADQIIASMYGAIQKLIEKVEQLENSN